eukprot:ANDGO_07833.mRNA.1 Translation machinery-associated protein 22
MAGPVVVDYCPKCKVPTEYCEYFGHGGAPAEGKTVEEPKEVKKKITVVVSARNKKKSLTTIYGLETFGWKLDDAAKNLKKRFACGAAMIKDASQRDCVQVQGNLEYELPEYLAELLEIDEDLIEVTDK